MADSVKIVALKILKEQVLSSELDKIVNGELSAYNRVLKRAEVTRKKLEVALKSARQKRDPQEHEIAMIRVLDNLLVTQADAVREIIGAKGAAGLALDHLNQRRG